MKGRLLVITAAALAALAALKKQQDAQAERDLWAEATDTVDDS
jgi:hypothetical protein